MRWWCLLALTACDDATFVSSAEYGSDWDGTREMLVRHCSDCHVAGNQPLPETDLRADRVSLPDAIVTDVCQDLGFYVVPGDPSESMLWRIVADQREPFDPPVMPSGRSRLSEAQLDDLEAWIRAGAEVDCD